LPIRTRLLLMVMTATVGALLLAAVFLGFAEAWRLEAQLREDQRALARILADNVTAALSFRDPRTAGELAEALRAKSHVVAACVYDAEGRRFAGFERGGRGLEVCPAALGDVRIGSSEDALVVEEVLLDGNRIGSVLVRSNRGDLRQRLRLQIGLLMLSMLVAAVVALLLSLRLQRRVSRPILELAGAAGRVQRDSDYALRVRRTSDDELGDLVVAFNGMLATIEARNADLKLANERLEQRVEERTRELAAELAERRRAEAELAERNRQLAASNRELDDFAYVASHDLKEPLRGIHNYAGFLVEDYADRLDAEGRAKLETLMRLSNRMEQLIDVLLEYSRVGRVDLALQPVRIERVVDEVLESLAVTIEAENVEIRVVRPLPTVATDAARIGEVFRNLLVNGIRYNDRGPKRLEIGAFAPGTPAGGVVPDGAEGPVFYVQDNGIGIPERHWVTVFDMFKRLHPRDAYGGGTGSGLAIVKKVIEKHGGRIWLDSEPGRGTKFFFTLRGERGTS